MGARVDRSDAYAAKKVSGGKDKRIGVVEIDFSLANSEAVNVDGRRQGDTEFKFLARDTVLPYVDNRALLVAGKPELHEYIATRRDVIAVDKVSQFNHAITVNCAPLV